MKEEKLLPSQLEVFNPVEKPPQTMSLLKIFRYIRIYRNKLAADILN